MSRQAFFIYSPGPKITSTSVPVVDSTNRSTVIVVGVVVPLVTITLIGIILIALLIVYKRRKAKRDREKDKSYMVIAINTTRMDIPDTDDDFEVHKTMTFPNNTPSNNYEITTM